MANKRPIILYFHAGAAINQAAALEIQQAFAPTGEVYFRNADRATQREDADFVAGAVPPLFAGYERIDVPSLAAPEQSLVPLQFGAAAPLYDAATADDAPAFAAPLAPPAPVAAGATQPPAAPYFDASNVPPSGG